MKSQRIPCGRNLAMLREHYIHKRIEDLVKLARVFDAQAEHNTAAKDQTLRQIEVLKQALQKKP